MQSRFIKYFLTGFICIFWYACNPSAPSGTSAKEAIINGNRITLTPAQVKNAGIETGTLNSQDMDNGVKVNGVVDVPPQGMISVSFPLGGYLKSTHLLPGTPVRKGEVIAIMEDPAYVQLQQDYLEAKARISYARADAQRQQELNTANAVSSKNAQLAQSTYRDLQVQLRGLEEKLKIININPAKVSLNHISRTIKIYSPINGYVSKVNANIGKYVTPSDVIFELVNPDDIHASMTVFENDILKFKKGMHGKVYVNGQPDQQYNVAVILVSQNVDDNRTGLVHCHFLDPGHNLMPGMYLSGVFRVPVNGTPHSSVPEDAVMRYEGKNYIFTTRDNRTFVLTPVTTGPSLNGYTELTGALPENKIVVKGAFQILSTMKNTGDEE